MNEKNNAIDWKEQVTKDNCGEKLRAVRRVVGMSRAELAQSLDCSVATLSRIETGSSRPTDAFMDTLRALCILGHEKYSKMTEAERNKILEYTSAGGGIGGGVGAAIASVSAAGAVPGLSAAGMTAGLAAVGGTMLGGLVVVAALPIAGGAIGFGIAKGIKRLVKANKLYTRTIDNHMEIYAGEPTDEWAEQVPEDFWQSIPEKLTDDNCGECLQEIRDVTGWSIKDLSRLTRLNESTQLLTKIEKGEKSPAKSFLNKLRAFCYRMQSELDEEKEDS